MILPSQGAVSSFNPLPRRAQNPYLRPNQGMIANGEINRMHNDPDFEMNKAAFYGETPSSSLVQAHDQTHFYRGYTPQYDKGHYERTQKALKDTANKVLTKSMSVPQLQQTQKDAEFARATNKFYGLDKTQNPR